MWLLSRTAIMGVCAIALIALFPFLAHAEGACQPHGFGCGSCVADGIWGSLWVNADCTQRCDKICGSEPASALKNDKPLISGPTRTTIDLQLDGNFSKQIENTVQSATILSKKPVGTRYQVLASHNSVWCGIFGPSNAEATCPDPQIAHCWCDAAAGGMWGIAKCECQQPPAPAPAPPPPSPVKNCSIPMRPHVACGTAGVLDATDVGCSTNCAQGFHGVCTDFSCVGNTFTHSFCTCAQ